MIEKSYLQSEIFDAGTGCILTVRVYTLHHTRDDSLKGDSNGDSDVTTPADGDWDGIDPYGADHYTWPNILYDSY